MHPVNSAFNGIIVPQASCVPDSAVSAAIKDVFNETRCCLEPAGAVAVAGAKAYLQRHDMQVHRTWRLHLISTELSNTARTSFRIVFMLLV